MVKPIQESLYRWQKEGWTVEKIENDQYTLVHPRARPVICGLRTQFQNVGTVQGEMQRALRDGPKTQPQIPAPPENKMPRRPKSKPKPKTAGEVFSFDHDRATKHPSSPYYRKPPPVIREPSPARPTVPFENAAWELAYLTYKLSQTDEHVIGIMKKRYQTDELYRSRWIRSFRETPQSRIQAMREQVGKREAAE